jgi:GT2 family glycosyltransferase
MASECLSRVSIVVLTFNRRVELLRTLHRLTVLPGRHAIIVVDNGSADGTVDAVRNAFPAVIAVRSSRNLGAAGRNLGVERVQTPYVAFSDDDTSWEAGSLEQALDILDAAPSVAVLNAKILIGCERRLDPSCEVMARSPLPGPPGVGP